MVNSIYIYALMKALYEEGQDYLDSFWPFAVMAIPSNKSVDISYIQRRLKEKYNLEMPLHVIGVVLARAEGKKLVKRERLEQEKYRLTGAGYTYAVKLENDREVERRITALLESIEKFLEQKTVVLSCDQIRELLLYFIQRNIDFLVECINPSIGSRMVLPQKFGGNDRYLLEYVQFADHQEPENYKMLENMVMGSIISALLYVEEPEDIAKIRTTRFSNCQIFLDTNIAFSMLGLDIEEFNEPATELLSLLKKNNFELKVFSFTIDEITYVLNSYSRENYRYPLGMKVNSLYSALKRKGWSKIDAREFIIHIERTLQQSGIKIEWIKGINLSNYKTEEALRNSIKKYKPDQNLFSQNHDLAAIAKIQEIRGKPTRKIEDSKAFFLTSDVKLSRFNLETGHKEVGTICETILDRLLTNILWLKNPNTKPPLKSIIAAHSRNLFVNRRVWDRFYGVLQELKESGKVKDEGISTLFWHNYVEDALRSIEDSDVNKITPQFVLEEIEKAEKKKEQDFEETKKEIEKIEKAGKQKEEDLETKRKGLEETLNKMQIELEMKEKEFSKNLESISNAKLQVEKEWLDKIQGIKQRVRGISESRAKLWSNILGLSLLLVFVISVLVAYFYFLVPLQVISLVITFTGFGGAVGLWKFAGKTKNWLFEYIYAKRLKEAELDEI